jgi:uncharacterized tellurite resistance protein B-like protein
VFGMFDDSRDTQLRIYYLYMLVDGEVTNEELKRFSTICKSMDVDSDEKKEIISSCKEAIPGPGSDNSAEVIQEITRLLAKSRSFIRNPINRDKITQTKVIWTLINLGYADEEYSEPEQKVVSFLADYWEMNSAVLSDMVDTAKTILALTKQKEWIKTTRKPYDTISAVIKEIDERIKRMFQNIEILISEAEIA